jgi:hypothetical protein
MKRLALFAAVVMFAACSKAEAPAADTTGAAMAPAATATPAADTTKKDSAAMGAMAPAAATPAAADTGKKKP